MMADRGRAYHWRHVRLPAPGLAHRHQALGHPAPRQLRRRHPPGDRAGGRTTTPSTSSPTTTRSTSLRDPAQLDEYTRARRRLLARLRPRPGRSTFYRQSDVPEIFELTWVLSCVTAKGLMNRAHAYKAARDRNQEAGVEDLDAGISMGLFSYPVLMAADILIMRADLVPVGKDQVQHVEMRATSPSASTTPTASGSRSRCPSTSPRTTRREHDARPRRAEDEQVVRQHDPALRRGRRRCKSWCGGIKTDSTPVEDPKDPDASSLFAIYRQFAGADDQEAVRARLAGGRPRLGRDEGPRLRERSTPSWPGRASATRS